jgi:hypothetical protein
MEAMTNLDSLRREYASVITKPESFREGARVAYRLAVDLGHSPMRQGGSVECYRCGASGTVGATLTGDVHIKACP